MNSFIMLVGLPGSGKSTYARRYKENDPAAVIVSSDEIRQELWGDANDQQNPGDVFNLMMQRSVAALNEGRNVIYDATNLSAKARKNTLAIIRNRTDNVLFICTFIACSLSTCKLRQGGRDRKVPDDVIDRMVRGFQTPWYNEGWDAIWVMEGGKLQDIDREHKRMVGESHDNHHHTLSLEMHCLSTCEKMKERLANINYDIDFRYALEEAAYQHDLGKHKTKAFLNTKGDPTLEAHYYNHDNVGAYLWLSGDKSADWDDAEFLFIAAMIQWHMQPYFLTDQSKEAFQDWGRRKGFDESFIEGVWLLHECDAAAH